MQPAYNPVGYMAIPPDYIHRDILEKGKPTHNRDAFYAKHPPMSLSRRAKIFAPFDALVGFDDAIESKNQLYVTKQELTEEEKKDLDHKLELLENLTRNSRLARQNHPQVRISYYVPCNDTESFSYRIQGQYKTLSGTCQKVNLINQTIQVENKILSLSEVKSIESETLFPPTWETA